MKLIELQQCGKIHGLIIADEQGIHKDVDLSGVQLPRQSILRIPEIAVKPLSDIRTIKSRPDFQGTASHPEGHLFDFINQALKTPAEMVLKFPVVDGIGAAMRETNVDGQNSQTIRVTVDIELPMSKLKLEPAPAQTVVFTAAPMVALGSETLEASLHMKEQASQGEELNPDHVGTNCTRKITKQRNPLDACWFCKQQNPDHKGADCIYHPLNQCIIAYLASGTRRTALSIAKACGQDSRRDVNPVLYGLVKRGILSQDNTRSPPEFWDPRMARLREVDDVINYAKSRVAF
eukprot:gnl/MRDRNA2_/MRDRNA2_321547_c0_seq1.p1 gnl/MRDRNA2_/MRDRNA2_321547_c0~~gnl/MRDRNA2_/MRDRNA2_321547_c0_seq1.p1  ORF type:complete len:327 (-),score=39.39 gnl/MRDRNA2_/MRDRNA2_321547_c0_seq1:176-1048(-)